MGKYIFLSSLGFVLWFDLSMPKDTAQVIFECPDAFRRRLFEEKLKRRTSIKRLIIEAVEEHWFSRGEPTEIITLKLAPDDPEQAHWADMFVQYMERCPPAKVKLLQSVIKEDLKMYRSKRKARRGRK